MQMVAPDGRVMSHRGGTPAQQRALLEADMRAYCEKKGLPLPAGVEPQPRRYVLSMHDDLDVGSGNFELALHALKGGLRVARNGWDGRVKFVVLMPELQLPPYNHQEPGPKVNDRTAKHIGANTPLNSRPYFALFKPTGEWQPGWVPSTGDLLANDWFLVE